MNKIIYYLSLIPIMIFFMFICAFDVFAAEASYYSAYFKPYTYESIDSANKDYDFFLNADEFVEYSDWITVENSYSNSYSYMGGVSFRVFGGSANTYLADNTYTFRFTLDFYNSTAAQRFKDNFICNSINGNSTSSSTGATAEQIDNYSCKIEEGSEVNRLLLYLYVKPANDLKYIRVYLRPKQLIPLSNADLSVSTIQLPYRYLELTYVKITYTEGTIAYIENQTATIINQTEMINNTINQRFDDFINSYNDAAQITQDIYLNETENGDGTCGGILCNLKKVVKGIINLPQTFLNGIIEGLKTVFIPTDDQLYEVINESKELSENFGFVGESVNFFLDIFTSLLGLVDSNGCIEFPGFTMGPITIKGGKGAGTLEERTFWEARQVCLADNEILEPNIDTIRTITSIAAVCMFIGFASSKFFKILSKDDSDFVKGRDRR